MDFAKGLDYESYLADMEVLKFIFLLKMSKINYFNYKHKIKIKALVQSLKGRIDEIRAHPEELKQPVPENDEEKKDNAKEQKIMENELSLNVKPKKEKDNDAMTQTSHKSKSLRFSLVL